MRHITAEEYYTLHNEDVAMNIGVFDQHSFTLQIMIDFTKYHVEQCKKAFLQSESFIIKDEWGTIEDSVVLDYYPLNNIK